MAAAWEAGEATEISVGSGTAAWYEFALRTLIFRLTLARLHEDAFKVTFGVTNTGLVYGGEVGLFACLRVCMR